ncbi:MAG: SgcJ/EcaC family oxidoreductase [Bacteroidota bacterium]
MGEHAIQSDEEIIRLLYKNLLESWNSNNATGFAELFMPDGNCIGFDGSQMNGRREINDTIAKIFTNHKVASYVGIVREVRLLGPAVFLLRAVAGMVPPGKTKINPEVNAIQTLIILKEQEQFRIALLQNTPAAFHEQPELREALTEELQEVFDGGKIV